MTGDAYGRLYGAMVAAGQAGARDASLRLRLGTVRAAEPLKVDVAGTDQESARFYIADRLLKGHRETVSPSGSLSVSASCPFGSHSGAGVGGGTLVVTLQEPVLRPGDLVLLLTEDDQTFYLIDKVVRLS